MASIIRAEGDALSQLVTIAEPTQLIFSGGGNLLVYLNGIVVATLNSANPIVDLVVAGDYTLFMVESCNGSMILCETIMCCAGDGGGPPVAPLASSIEKTKYLPNGVAPCVCGWLILKEDGLGGITQALTDEDGASLDILTNPIVY